MANNNIIFDGILNKINRTELMDFVKPNSLFEAFTKPILSKGDTVEFIKAGIPNIRDISDQEIMSTDRIPYIDTVVDVLYKEKNYQRVVEYTINDNDLPKEIDLPCGISASDKIAAGVIKNASIAIKEDIKARFKALLTGDSTIKTESVTNILNPALTDRDSRILAVADLMEEVKNIQVRMSELGREFIRFGKTNLTDAEKDALASAVPKGDFYFIVNSKVLNRIDSVNYTNYKDGNIGGFKGVISYDMKDDNVIGYIVPTEYMGFSTSYTGTESQRNVYGPSMSYVMHIRGMFYINELVPAVKLVAKTTTVAKASK